MAETSAGAKRQVLSKQAQQARVQLGKNYQLARNIVASQSAPRILSFDPASPSVNAKALSLSGRVDPIAAADLAKTGKVLTLSSRARATFSEAMQKVESARQSENARLGLGAALSGAQRRELVNAVEGIGETSSTHNISRRIVFYNSAEERISYAAVLSMLRSGRWAPIRARWLQGKGKIKLLGNQIEYHRAGMDDQILAPEAFHPWAMRAAEFLKDAPVWHAIDDVPHEHRL